MKSRPHTSALPVLLAGLTLWTLVGCRAGNGQTVSMHPRPPNEANAYALVQHFGGRAPRPCPAIRHRPSDAEAAILAQCTMEGPFGTIETLLTDVQVHITGSRRFSTNAAGFYDGQDNNRQDIDNREPVLTLVGYARQYACGELSFMPGKNCTMTEMPNSPGACWKTSYGEYRCNFVNIGVGYFPYQPPPAKY